MLLIRELWNFLRDSTPERRRRRYGDMEFDWEHRVNTTSGTVGWRERLLGMFHSPYQPSDAASFHAMMATLPIDFAEFTFVDLGSGKGRTLLMASDYPFQKIIGVEILLELNRAAAENVRDYASPAQQCKQIESLCADAREFEVPTGPLLLYLFNPLPAHALERVLRNVEDSLHKDPRPIYLLYYHPEFKETLSGGLWTQVSSRADQFALFLSTQA